MLENRALTLPPYSHGTRGKWFNLLVSKLVWEREPSWKQKCAGTCSQSSMTVVTLEPVNMLPYFAKRMLQVWLRIWGFFRKDAIIRVFIRSLQETRVGEEVHGWGQGVGWCTGDDSQLPDAGRGRGPVSLWQPPEWSSAYTYPVFGSV